MCYFITVGIGDAHAEALQRQLSGTFGAAPVFNESILKHLPAGHLTFNLGGVCSCHLYSKAHAEPLDAGRLRSKYEKKGWSESKISRAISGKLSAQRESFKGLRPDLLEQLCKIAAEVGRLFLVVHFYSGGVESEAVTVAGKKVVACDSLVSDDDLIPEDMLIEVVAKVGAGDAGRYMVELLR